MNRRGDVRLQLRTRLVLALSALVVAAVAVTAWMTLSHVTDAFETRFDERVTALLRGVEGRLDALGRRTADRMDTLTATVPKDRRLMEHLLVEEDPSHSEVVQAAERFSGLSGMELLQLMDQDGTILSSAQWPERVGFDAGSLIDLPDGTPAFLWERTPTVELLAQVVRRSVRLGDRTLHLVGGRFVDREFLEQLGPTGEGDSVVLLDGRKQALLAVGGLSLHDATRGQFDRALNEALREGEAGRGQFITPAGVEWSAGSMPLKGPDGESLLGFLLVGADRAELEVLLARLRNRYLLAGTAGALLAAVIGLWVARRITRPVAELVRGVELISEGREHDPFPAGGDDEIGRLMTAFSRMDLSLRTQRHRLLAAERVAAWKEVAQRLAHEIKNPLSPIRLAVENLIKARRQAPQMFDRLFDEGTKVILEEVSQLGHIVTEFSEFARLPSPSPKWADLETLVDSVLSLYTAEPGLAVRRVQAAPLPRVYLDPEQISRAIKNLVKNAVEAMSPQGGGTLQVTTALEGEEVVVEVCDTGPGFPEDTRGRIFEPYFTTKVKGTGLGMAIALRIISDHGGHLDAANREGGGARVTVTLPVSGVDVGDPGGGRRDMDEGHEQDSNQDGPRAAEGMA